ncbi:MAG: hypothetical protein ISP01_07680 [Methanobrevibacter arboriphilus]|jgi:hypothetical protein|uniref:Uncharacterized protein n=2 Tax=Methanobrevibacter arboriphilus TaxID=39441 RepID=A0A843AH93_METAZ|nr:hypothetical protein [Methanobrevibacter arboriphilus]MBF4469273.1 hypothetical protein [Methanobrevibacter arboriphilus]MCC7562215.1 hypothetical protein [Methanobrevibacter arboriphilus]BBL61373.1 hypothetical protein MarbSA_04130 [Methanobrevibacter arboriphilus]GLI11291.1 hypothetical protein MARBORIA2_03810 [Methanobrevibacter arboriphilus]
MTINDTNYDKIKDYAVKYRQAVNELLENDVAKLKDKSISPELNKFWDEFEDKFNKVKSGKKDNQIFNLYVALNDGRSVVITEMDTIEPWFVKIIGVNCENGENTLEIINSRSKEPEIVLELIDL